MPLLRRLAALLTSGRVVALAVAAGLIWLRLFDPYVTEVLRNRTFDFYQKVQPRVFAPRPVAIIDIDEKSLTRLGQWPWPRHVVAALVDRLREQGVAAVAFDIVFSEPDRLSPDRFANGLAGLSEAARNELAALPDNDAALAAAFARGRVIIGQSGLHTATPPAEGVPETPVATIGGDPTPFLVKYPGLLTNIAVLEQAAKGRGLFSILPDPDGIVRRIPLAASVAGRVLPSLTVETLRVATGQDAFAVKRDEAGVRSVVVAGVEIATDRNAHLWLHFTGHEPRRYVSAVDVLEGKVPPGRLAGHLVLVGTSAVGLFDLRPTPLDPAMPGVEVHAQVLETVLGKSQLVRPHYALGAEIVAAAGATLFVVALLPALGALWTMLAGAGLAAIIAGGAWWLFAQHQMLLDPVFPLVTSAAAFAVLFFVNYRREELRRAQIRSAFSHYLSPSMVETLTRDPSRLALGGERRRLTVLFSDVRGFTGLSEGFRDDPQGLIELMNRLLTPLTNTIIHEQGTIDKYMGDAIMAFWNAPLDVPDHAVRAARAALAMQAAMGAVNIEAQETAAREGRTLGTLSIGVGLNTGDCVVGNMGSSRRFDYSVLGDTVNLASRLEGQTKAYGVGIVVGEASAAEIAGQFALIELDLVRVKGKKAPERIHALIGDETVRASDEFAALRAATDEALSAYRAQRWDEAERKCAAAAPLAAPFGVAGYFTMLEERITVLRSLPPAADWDGVHEALSK